MPSLSGIYDSAAIQPICKIKENLAIWTAGNWAYSNVRYIEPMPPGPAMMVEMVVASGATTLAAGATIGKQVVAILALSKEQFLQVRFQPLDNVEGVIWEQAGQQKFSTGTVHSRVDRQTILWDENLVTTQFWIVGNNRNMQLEVRNPMAVATPVARFVFFGYRYLLDPIDISTYPADVQLRLQTGDPETVKQTIKAVTFVPAEGRNS